ncbi:hypothetical protein [Bradyrhizobium sp.]
MAKATYLSSVLLVASTLMTTPCFAQSKRIILGVGVQDCAAYSRVSVTSPDQAGLSLQMNFILGFLAAANSYEQGDILRGATTPDVIRWFDNYCSAHPEDSITRALQRYVKTEGGR